MSDFSWSPDGSQIAVSSYLDTITLVDSKSGEVRLVITDHPLGIDSVAWSPDGNQLLAAVQGSSGVGGGVKIFDAVSGELLRYMPTDSHLSERSAAWSPDGVQVSSGGDDGRVKTWNASTGTLLWTSSGQINVGVTAVKYSPDGATVAAGDNNGPNNSSLRLWDAGSGEELGAFRQNSVSSLSWSADGCCVLTGSPTEWYGCGRARHRELVFCRAGQRGVSDTVKGK